MTFRLIKVFLITFFSIIALTACETKKPTPPKEDLDNVARGLEVSTDFERDTVRKDAVKVVKKKMINPKEVTEEN